MSFRNVNIKSTIQLSNHGWVWFLISTVIGFFIPIILVHTFNRALAEPIIDLDRFDPSIYPAIDVSHNPPLISSLDEKAKLEFILNCGYSTQVGSCCHPNAMIFVTYGNKSSFDTFPLTEVNRDSLRVYSADFPSNDENGEPLRYFIRVSDTENGIDIRYPMAGTIDLFVVNKFIPVALPSHPPVNSGNVLLALPWGAGPEEVGLRESDGYPAGEGPLAIDVARDGRIALLDHVNHRVLVFNPTDGTFAEFPLPFRLHSQGDIQFDRDGRIAVFDPVGEPESPSTVNIPRLHLFQPGGQIEVVAPVFARAPAWLTENLEVVDLSYSKLVVPINASGEANPRDLQQLEQPARLLVKSLPDTVYSIELADVEKEIAFQVHSQAPLGAVVFFARIPTGYLVVFEGDRFRAVWIDPTGKLLQDLSLRRDDYSEIYSLGRLAADPSGSLVILQSLSGGIEIRQVKSP